MSRRILGVSFVVLPFGILFFFTLWPLLAMKRGFTLGDYEVQIYPWLWDYARAMGRNQISLWTHAVQSGFPIFAEGQTAPLYLWNLVLFRFLPFKFAYNVYFLAHFVMAGGFMTLFARKRGFTREAAALATISFVFGSAIGGFFYGIFSMRALVWFPLILWAVEDFLVNRRVFALAILAFALGQSFIAGNPQTAFYAAGFTAIYAVLRSLEISPRAGRHVFGRLLPMCFPVAIAVLIGLPQLWATVSIGLESSRAFQDKSLVLWGSVAPWSFAGLLIYPWSEFFRSYIYIGIIPILLCVILPQWRLNRIFWILTGLSVLAALGRFNPMYWAAMHLPGFSLLRNPSKFLFFTSFFLSLIAAASLDRLSNDASSNCAVFSRQLRTRLVKWLAACVLILVGAYLFAHVGAGLVTSFGDWYVDKFVAERSYHPHSIEHYRESVRSWMGVISAKTDWRYPWIWTPLLFGGILMWGLSRFRRPGAVKGSKFRVFCLWVLAADLFIFIASGHDIGFTGNIGEFPDLQAAQRMPRSGKWLDNVDGEKAVFLPSRNMMTGHVAAGVYSPLADALYANLFKGLGAVDNGFGFSPWRPGEFEKKRRLMDFLNVRYVRVRGGLCPEGTMPRNEEGIEYCVNESALGRYTAVKGVLSVESQKEALRIIADGGWDPASEVILENSPAVAGGKVKTVFVAGHNQIDGRQSVYLTSSESGYLVRPVRYAPGWKAYLDGHEVTVLRANGIFQAVAIREGNTLVEFVFEPDYWVRGIWFFLAGWLFLALLFACGSMYVGGRTERGAG